MCSKSLKIGWLIWILCQKHTIEWGNCMGKIVKKTKSLLYRKTLKSKYLIWSEMPEISIKCPERYTWGQTPLSLSLMNCFQTLNAVFLKDFFSDNFLWFNWSQQFCQNSKLRILDYFSYLCKITIKKNLGIKCSFVIRFPWCFGSELTKNSRQSEKKKKKKKKHVSFSLIN